MKTRATLLWTAWFFLALAWIPPTLADEMRTTSLDLKDGTSIPLRIFPGRGDSLLLWIACDEGRGVFEALAAQQLSAQGTEVWLSDLLSARFIPFTPSGIKGIPGADVAALIEQARAATHKKIYLIAAGPASLPALRGALEWQHRHSDDAALAGGILLYPDLYAATPEPGVEAAYYPEVARTALPLFIYHSQRSPGRWWLEHLVADFRKGGSSVESRVLPGVRGFFYGREDATADETAMAKRLPELVAGALRNLKARGEKK